MSALTPEIQAELRRLLDTPPQHITIARDDALALLDAAAERDALAESVRAYGRTIDRWGLLIIAATHSEDITTPDGDGDWEVIESRLAEVPALLAERDALAAAVERARVLATEWATQPTDYDEDTEQQIEDGNAILRALDATPETGCES